MRNWFSTPQGFLLLACLTAVNALLAWGRGENMMAVFFVVLAVAVAARAWVIWRRSRVNNS